MLIAQREAVSFRAPHLRMSAHVAVSNCVFVLAVTRHLLSGRVSKMKWKIHATEFQQFGITGLIFAAAAVLGILHALFKTLGRV